MQPYFAFLLSGVLLIYPVFPDLSIQRIKDLLFREVKKLIPELYGETGSKSYIRFQFYGFGNKSYR